MKKLDWLILRSFLGPLALTFAISVFVLLMQFVWKYIDDMVGKGLDFSVIAELLLYASATFVPMALPIAVLFASIMTMGNFGEKYELVAMKASGISVSRAMMPMTLVVLVLTGVAFYFANNVMPEAMLRYRMTLYDITRKKPAVNIRAGEYYKDIEGYVIRVGSKDPDNGVMRDIIIYDHSKGMSETNVIVARSGVMRTTLDNSYLLFSLDSGYTYTEPTTGEYYRKRPLTSINFRQQTIAFDISSFAYNRSTEDLFRGGYQTMNVSELNQAIAHLDSNMLKRRNDCRVDAMGSLRLWQRYHELDSVARPSGNCDVHKMLAAAPEQQQRRSVARSRNLAATVSRDCKSYADILDSDQEYINRHHVVKQRKFTLSLACLLLFLIGAPFGSIVRKGGLGLPLVASVGFFVFYYVIDMIDEKSVRESVLGPEGMWISSLVLLPIGIFLTLQATTDSGLFDATSWKRFFARLLPQKKSKNTTP